MVQDSEQRSLTSCAKIREMPFLSSSLSWRGPVPFQEMKAVFRWKRKCTCYSLYTNSQSNHFGSLCRWTSGFHISLWKQQYEVSQETLRREEDGLLWSTGLMSVDVNCRKHVSGNCQKVMDIWQPEFFIFEYVSYLYVSYLYVKKF
jgi:hypothetical protein